jgi:two-component system, NarL family, sensor histidine kinase NreB
MIWSDVEVVSDHGRGFELEKVREGLGFLSMRERAGEVGGEFRREAQPGGGTRLCLVLPLPKSSNRIATPAAEHRAPPPG